MQIEQVHLHYSRLLRIFDFVIYTVAPRQWGWVKSPEGTATGGSETDDKPNGIPNLFGYS